MPAGQTQSERLAEFWRRYPHTREQPPQKWPDIMFPKIFGEISAPLALADLLPVVREWRPAVVVDDAAELAAPIAAAAVGVPNLTHSFGALVPEARVRAGGEEVAPLWRAHGLEPRPYGGVYDHLYLDIYPPSLQPPGGDHVNTRQLLRPVPFDGGSDERLPEDIVAKTGPLVYLTFGTVFNDNAAFRDALTGIRDLGVNAVVTVGPNGDPAVFGPQPTHVRLERYIPQTLVLPACDVVVSHGGSGTVLGALGMGIPQLCLPQAADQFINAAAVASARSGIAIPPADVDSAAVAAAIRRLLDDPTFRRNAASIADEIAAMPSPQEVVTVLETLA